MKKLLFLFCFLVMSSKAISCTCYPHTDTMGFCQVLPGLMSKPMFRIVQARILSFYHWGMYVQVTDNVYGGSAQDTLLVWADCGACCRPGIVYEGFQAGDTLVMALQQTDFTGNLVLPQTPDYEDSTHYMLSNCGAHFLRFRSGKVTGAFNAVTSQSVPDTIDYPVFKMMVEGCMASPTKISGNVQAEQSLHIFPNPAGTTVHISAAREMEKVEIFDRTGQSFARIQFRDARLTIDVSKYPPGLYMLVVSDKSGRLAARQTFLKQ
jgi:hypothetical protein